ncbi:MAG: right-handed parallel beta-helix repeat-containing protein [Anaerolineaceae bacterium]|nr:right-handed parallel beta-helix repeat-containing protein [Anaerolineaceae bacterium]
MRFISQIARPTGRVFARVSLILLLAHPSSIHIKEPMMNHKPARFTLALSVILTLLALLWMPAGPARAVSQIFITPNGSGDCSQASPCSLTNGLALALEGDTIFAGAGVYTAASGNEVVLLDQPVNFNGGWNGAPSGGIVRNQNAYISIIDGQNARRGMTINYTPSATVYPVVSGWTIRNGNATGLSDTCSVWAFTGVGCGGGIYINGADPMIVSNIIHSNNAAMLDTGLGGGGGIYLLDSEGAIIVGNEIHGNNSNPAGEGWGGGIYIHNSRYQTYVESNDIHNNDSSIIDEAHIGSGIAINNNLDGIEVTNNQIHDNGQASLSYNGSAIFCQYCSNQVNIESNQMLDNHGDNALALSYSSPLVQLNTIINPGSNTGFYFGSGAAGQIINVFNNIIARHAETNIHGAQTSFTNTSMTLFHNSLADAPIGISIENSPGLGSLFLQFSNGIVSGHSVTGISTSGPVTLVVTNTLFHANEADGVTGSDPFFGDPAFKSPVTYNYHLSRGSQAIDRIASGLHFDIDGDARPFGSGTTAFDAGADEFIHSLFFFLPVTVR